MSLNAKLDAARLVLRVHQPSVSRRRLFAQQAVRGHLADQGLVVPTTVPWNGSTVLRRRNRWAEVETFIAHERLTPSLDSYMWMFRAMGFLHRRLAQLDIAVPRPAVATYVPPGSLRRWLPGTERVVQDKPEAEDAALRCRTRWLHGEAG